MSKVPHNDFKGNLNTVSQRAANNRVRPNLQRTSPQWNPNPISYFSPGPFWISKMGYYNLPKTGALKRYMKKVMAF